MSIKNKGSTGLPEEYWIETPRGSDNAKFVQLFNEFTDGNIAGSNNYYKIVNSVEYDSSCHFSSKKPSDGAPIYQYTQWKAMIEGIEEYKVGDYIRIINNGCICCQGNSPDVLNKSWKITETGWNGGYDWSYKLEIMPNNIKGIAGDGDIKTYLRYATLEEIQKAQGTSDIWCVGNSVVVQCAKDNGVSSHSDIGRWYQAEIADIGYSATGLSAETIANGKGYVVLLKEGPNKGKYRRVLKEHVKESSSPVTNQVPVTESKRVRIKNYRAQQEYEGQIGIVIDEKKGGGTSSAITVKMNDGKILWPYRPGSAEAQCEWVTEPINNQVVDNKWYIEAKQEYGGLVIGQEVELINDDGIYDNYKHPYGGIGSGFKSRFSEKYQKTVSKVQGVNNQLTINQNQNKQQNGKEAEYISTAIRFKSHLRADIKAVTTGEGGESYSARREGKSKIVEEQYRKDTGCIGQGYRPKGQYIGQQNSELDQLWTSTGGNRKPAARSEKYEGMEKSTISWMGKDTIG